MGVSNRARYSNPKLDALVEAGRTTLDTDKRRALTAEAQRMWMDDAPWIMTVNPDVYESMGSNISGWVPHPDDHERWVDLRAG
jgi:peptide/nickel transport system substrate-binding protein